MRPADWQTGVVTIATETPFVLLYDYRCPFAKNVHDHVIAALRSGLALSVTFTPYTLSQGHVESGSPAVWDDPLHDGGLLALEASVAVRDTAPEHFLALHEALFAARHEHSISLTTREQVDAVLVTVGVDPEPIWSEVSSGRPRAEIATAWTHYHDDLDVFGVPTFIVDDADATFVRLMDGPDRSDPAASVDVVSGLLDLIIRRTDINALKHTRLNR